MQALIEFARRILDVEPPSVIQPAQGRKRDQLKHEAEDIVNHEEFDGQAWNQFCGNMIRLLGGKKQDTRMWSSNPLPNPEGEVSLTISRVKDPIQFNRGVISTTFSLSKGISIIETVSFGDKYDALVANKPIRSVGVESFRSSPNFPLVVSSYAGDEVTLYGPNMHHDIVSMRQAQQLCREVFAIYQRDLLKGSI